jgi:hypothetical protein
MAAAPDTAAAPAPPPNLRMSEQEAKECGSCIFYDNVHCSKFPPLCVDDEWLCDAWKAGGKDTDVDQGPPPRTVREAQRQSLARLRAAKTSGQ